MGKFFGNEKVSSFVYLGTNTARLNSGSFLKIGGQGYNLSSNLTLDMNVTGFGGVEGGKAASKFYYVYAVLQSGSVGLIASESASKPTNFNSYRKVGAVWNNSNSELQAEGVWSFGDDYNWIVRGEISGPNIQLSANASPNQFIAAAYALTMHQGQGGILLGAGGSSLGNLSDASARVGMLFDAPLAGDYEVDFHGCLNSRSGDGGGGGNSDVQLKTVLADPATSAAILEGQNASLLAMANSAVAGSHTVANSMTNNNIFTLSQGSHGVMMGYSSASSGAGQVIFYLNAPSGNINNRETLWAVKSSNIKIDWSL